MSCVDFHVLRGAGSGDPRTAPRAAVCNGQPSPKKPGDSNRNGGFTPSRDELVPALLLSLGVAFLGTCVLVLSLFDIARFERSELPEPKLAGAMARVRTRRQQRANADQLEGPGTDGDPRT